MLPNRKLPPKQNDDDFSDKKWTIRPDAALAGGGGVIMCDPAAFQVIDHT